MKIFHLADLHLGSEMNARLSKERARLRREEICIAFDRVVERAKREGVRAILLSGDVFDVSVPTARDKEFFYDVVRQAPDVLFFYLKGNHDDAEVTEALPNLKTFTSDAWTTYSLEDGVTVSGIELTASNADGYYDTLHLDGNKTNIVMLHGQVSESKGEEKIQVKSLAGKGIDYLALGHIHSYQDGRLDARGAYAYSGCLEPRGFDELGPKGFVRLEVGQGVSYAFEENSLRRAYLQELDVSGLTGLAEVLQKAEQELTVSEDDILRLVLVGEAAFDMDGAVNMLQNRWREKCFALSVKDETERALDLSKYDGQVSIEAEFIRIVMANEKLTERQKKEVISLGLKALSGGKL